MSADQENGEPRRGRGRPPGLRTLLLERFPDGATFDQLREAGYDADPLQEIYLKPPFVDFDEQTGIYSIRRGNRGRPAMTEAQRAAKDRERVLRGAEQLGLRLNADEGVTEYETTGPDGEPTLALHPLCALFPRMEGAELEELAEDIRRNGQREPGTLYQSKIIDGGNRFQGCRIAGRKFCAREYKGDDPLGFVLATNYRRRHLTLEQRRQFRQGVIKLYPDKSDRALAELLGVDHKTIAADRAALEQTGEISPVERRTGLDGKARQQPAPKPPRPIGVKIDKVTVDPAITAAGIDRVSAMLKRPPIAHDYVPPPKPTALIPNQQEISARVDLARSSSAERLAQIPEQPDDDYGSLSFRVPADPKRMAKCILDKVGHQQASEVLDALAALLAPPQTKTLQ